MRIATGERVRLAAEIRADLLMLEPHTRRLIAFVQAGEQQDADALVAAAVALHHSYCALESAFERIERTFEGDRPRYERWHMELLHSMFLELEGLRPAVLALELRQPLSTLLSFRHVFRMAYSASWPSKRLVMLGRLHLDTIPRVELALQPFIRQLQQPDTSE
jgi:hypothetical protein